MVRRRCWLLVLVAATGCRGLLGIEEPLIADAGSAATDTPADTSCGRSSARFDACALGTPGPALHLTAGGYTFDTTPVPAQLRADSSSQSVVTTALTYAQSDGQTAAILYVSALSVDSGATVRIVGTRPAIFIAEGDMVISGDLDAGSHLAEISATTHVAMNIQFGAGANQVCAVAGGKPGVNAPPTAGSGGGGGGAHAGRGGTGGVGDNGAAAGGLGGAERGAPTTVRAGCAGGSSGAAGSGAVSPATQATMSTGGAGGGAIHLAAFRSIRILGRVLAGGAGGAGSPQGAACGGGGGGSGGYIGLEAPTVTIEGGKLATNGGGGGAGAPTAGFGDRGSDGRDGTDVSSGGMAGITCGTGGGNGGSLALNGQNVAGTDSCGGGGGGGGAGFILIWSPAYSTAAAIISPAPQTDPP